MSNEVTVTPLTRKFIDASGNKVTRNVGIMICPTLNTSKVTAQLAQATDLREIVPGSRYDNAQGLNRYYQDLPSGKRVVPMYKLFRDGRYLIQSLNPASKVIEFEAAITRLEYVVGIPGAVPTRTSPSCSRDLPSSAPVTATWTTSSTTTKTSYPEGFFGALDNSKFQLEEDS